MTDPMSNAQTGNKLVDRLDECIEILTYATPDGDQEPWSVIGEALALAVAARAELEDQAHMTDGVFVTMTGGEVFTIQQTLQDAALYAVDQDLNVAFMEWGSTTVCYPGSDKFHANEDQGPL